MSRPTLRLLSGFFPDTQLGRLFFKGTNFSSDGRGTLTSVPMNSEEAQASITQNQREEQAKLIQDKARELMNDPNAVEYSMVRGDKSGMVHPQDSATSSSVERAVADALAGKSRDGSDHPRHV